jgi:hypothetical protein
MAKILMEFEGPAEYLQLGITCLAVGQGWTPESKEEPLELARQAIAKFTRQAVIEYQQKQADSQTQAIIDEAIAKKEAIMAQVTEGTAGALDAVKLTVSPITEEKIEPEVKPE